LRTRVRADRIPGDNGAIIADRKCPTSAVTSRWSRCSRAIAAVQTVPAPAIIGLPRPSDV
jgi:hypothetical protein